MAGNVTRLTRFNMTSLALGLAFLYLPIVILVIYSFNASRLVTVWGGWSLRWYHEFFSDRAMLEAAWMSLSVAAVSAKASFHPPQVAGSFTSGCTNSGLIGSSMPASRSWNALSEPVKAISQRYFPALRSTESRVNC